MNTSNALFTTPFDHNTDFIDLADNCERFCEALVEETDPARKMALCGRLATSLALLRPMLLEPVPEYLQERLTVDAFPSFAPNLPLSQISTAVTAKRSLNCSLAAYLHPKPRASWGIYCLN